MTPQQAAAARQLLFAHYSRLRANGDTPQAARIGAALALIQAHKDALAAKQASQ